MDNSSIFSIERRMSLKEAIDRFEFDLIGEITPSGYSRCTIRKYLNHCLRFWPYRCGASSISDYLLNIGINDNYPMDDSGRLFWMELIINLLHYAPEQEKKDIASSPFTVFQTNNEIEDETTRLLENAEFILEQCCNATVREEETDGCPKYYITKRNAHVDSAVIAVPELKDVLLGYHDIRTADNIQHKENSLITICDYLEPLRKELKGLSCSTISEEFFRSMNEFNIRHNNEKQIILSPEEKKTVCDELFMMAVYVLQTKEVNNYHNQLKLLRETKRNKVITE